MIEKILNLGFNEVITTESNIEFFECEGNHQNTCSTTRLLKNLINEECAFIDDSDLFWYTSEVYMNGKSVRVFNPCIACSNETIFYCQAHERYEYDENRGVFIGNGYACRKSEGEFWVHCPSCGDTVKKSLLLDYGCLNCADTVEIYEYHEFDDLEFFGSPSDDMYYGVEIETSYDKEEDEYLLSDYDLFRKVIKMNDTVDNLSHYEEDCSISGIECVTQPMSYEFLQNNLHHITTHLEECGFYTKSGNGLHIHISRTDFIHDNIHRILYFFENNKDNIIKFSGRNSEELRRWADFYYENSLSDCFDVLYDIDDRYKCINNTNYNTVEFRIFRSELNPKLILGAVEFIQILVDMMKNNQALSQIGFDEVLDYARQNNYHNFMYRFNYYIL